MLKAIGGFFHAIGDALGSKLGTVHIVSGTVIDKHYYDANAVPEKVDSYDKGKVVIVEPARPEESSWELKVKGKAEDGRQVTEWVEVDPMTYSVTPIGALFSNSK
jgi:hypothetical protein